MLDSRAVDMWDIVMTDAEQKRIANFTLNVDEKLDTCMALLAEIIRILHTLLNNNGINPEFEKSKELLLQLQSLSFDRERNRQQIRTDLNLD